MDHRFLSHLLLQSSLSWGTVSGWWTIGCLALGIVYAWVMYRQPTILNRKFIIMLTLLRALWVSIIAFLLVSPAIKSVSYDPQKPLILIAQDNSTSIKTFKPANFSLQQFSTQLHRLKQQLGNEYDVREYHFDADLHEGLLNTYTGEQTNIAGAIHQLNDAFVNQNIGALILASDGLYNQGADPQYEARNFKTNIYTIALGDTLVRRDLLISNINYNKTALLGNDFIMEVLTEAYQSQGETLHFTITEDGRTIYTENISIKSSAFRKTIPVKLSADKKGIHKFTLSLAPVSNELSVQNNSQTVYIEVLDTRQKVLLLYNSPHPDIAVIKQAIEHNRNYELKAVQATNAATLNPAGYGLFVIYQCALSDMPGINAFIKKSKSPVWYITGAQTNLNAFNQQQSAVQINTNRPDMQEAFAATTPGFSLFTLSDSTLRKIDGLPPLLAPFGTYSLAAGTTPLLKQRIGHVITSYPLLAFNEANGQRTAVLTGEGIWRWSLAEYQTYASHAAVEELLSQTVQYLTANANRQRFRAYPAKNVFDESEDILFDAELYNDALELVNTPEVNMAIKSSKGKVYNFLFSRNGKSYQLNAGTLPAGVYTYYATTRLGKQAFKTQGLFNIEPLDTESRMSTANHRLLYGLAKQSGGQMLMPSQINDLANLIKRNDNIKTIEYANQHYSDLIDLKWVFFLALSLLSTEWFLRKREGEI